MTLKRYARVSKVIIFLIGAVWLIGPLPARTEVQANSSIAGSACRFGINSPLDRDDYDIASLGVASYLDWGAVTNPSLPPGVEYIHVLRLRDDLYAQTLANLPAWVQANPGAVWVVGNEPDTTYEYQDALLPEEYADRYYELAIIIRQLDHTAQIAFGPIVQPTPIRIRYLQRAWNRLAAKAGSSQGASNLVDIWAPHAFILNEDTRWWNNWGTGVPPGFEGDHADAFIIEPDHFSYTYSIDIFQERIIAFRLWMASIGERNKPLWITEYGSLFPPVDPIGGPNYVNVTDELTAQYMVNTFDFMMAASDNQSGMAADGNQLVQRWFWYSLNDHRYHFGGSLYNPDYPDYPEYGDSVITLVGEAFIGYQADHLSAPDLTPVSLSIRPISYNDERTLVNYRLDVTVDNNQFEDASCGVLRISDGDPGSGGTLVAGPLLSSAFQADYGTARVTAYWMGVEPLTEHTLCVVVDAIGVEDTDPSNNQACYSVYLGQPILSFLPIVSR
jgi:hypothetical protein